MKNLRIKQRPRINPYKMGFAIDHKNFDFTVRMLGAAVGKLAFFDEMKTTTLGIKATENNLDEVRALFEEVVLDADDFSYSVSVPYVTVEQLLEKVEEIYAQK